MTPSGLRGRYRRILRFFAGVIARFLWWDVVLRRLGFAALGSGAPATSGSVARPRASGRSPSRWAA